MSDLQPIAPVDAAPVSGPLAQRVARGAIWTMAATTARIASAILILPVLTRLLSPEDFGLIQLAMPLIFFMMVFSDFGLQPALIVAEKPTDKLWSTAFWTGMGAATILTSLLVIAAPFIADFYNEPRAELILQVLAITMFASGTMIVPGAWFLRTMNFRVLAIVEFTTVTSGIIVALTCAVAGFGVWSLVLQQLVMYSLKATALCIASKAPLKFEFSWAELKSMMNFGVSMTNTRFMLFLSRNVDMIIIGRFLGATALGFYSIAWRVMMMPIEIFANGLFQVMLPTIGQIKDEPDRLKAALFKTYRMISLFTFPAMAGIAALSGPLTRFVFGEEFAPAAFPMAALAIHGAIQSLLFMQGSVFLALNRVDIMFRWSVITVVVLVVFLLVGVQWGLEGASLGYLAATLICAPLNFRALLSLIGARLADAWAALRVHTTITVFMALAVYGLTLALPANWPPLFVLMAGIPAGVILYVGGLAVLDRKAITEVIGIVRSILARKSAG